MNVTSKFPRSLLKDDWDVPYGGNGMCEVIRDDIVETNRWSAIHDVVFRAPDDGLLYMVDYSVGLTEYQDESPWEDLDEVVGTQVEVYEKTTLDYRAVTK